jgi:formate hydrogenlyase transcriptional activator
VDVRVIAATNRNLEEAVQAGRFRADLFYRLNVVPLVVPPLRERPADVPSLVMFFLAQFAKRFGKRIETVPPETMTRLSEYAWPGNIRELQNVIERAVILSRGAVLALPREVFESAVPLPASAVTLVEAERDHILRALEQTGWVIGGAHGAAVRLGLKRTSLVSTMRRLGIVRPKPAAGANRDIGPR